MPIPIINATQKGLIPFTRGLVKISSFQSKARDNIYTDVLDELGDKLATRLRLNSPHGVTGDLARSTDFHITIVEDSETHDILYT